VNTFVINAATGTALSQIPFSGLPIGTQLLFQSGTVSAAALTFPLAMGNVEVGTILF